MGDSHPPSPPPVTIRELSPADAPACEAFFGRLHREDIRLRFAGPAIPLGYITSRLARAQDGAAIAAIEQGGIPAEFHQCTSDAIARY